LLDAGAAVRFGVADRERGEAANSLGVGGADMPADGGTLVVPDEVVGRARGYRVYDLDDVASEAR
jgi:hypothetical protein